MLAFTHILFAWAVAKFLDKNRKAAVLFSVSPEIDILLNYATPLVRNGMLHSLLAAVILTVIVETIFADRKLTYGTFIGINSHLLLDLLSFERIMLFFPIKSFYSLSLFAPYSLMENLAVISVSFLILLESEKPAISELFFRKNKFF